MTQKAYNNELPKTIDMESIQKETHTA